MRIKMFSHRDLDAIGCAILAKALDPKVSPVLCNYDEINDKVKEFITSGEIDNYDRVFITDISVNEEVAEMIDKLKDPKVVLLDHHTTAIGLNKYNWAHVCPEMPNGFKNSGISLFYEWILKNLVFISNVNLFIMEKYKEFVELVRAYDTWDWTLKEDGETSKRLNDLFYIYGATKFIKEMNNRINSGKALFTKADLLLLTDRQNQIDRYIYKKEKELAIYDFPPYKMGVIFAESYISELGNTICIHRPDMDFIAIVSGIGSVSYRTIKEDLDLGKEIASLFGGGGHPKAAGNIINNKTKDQILQLIFDDRLGKKL